MKIVKYYMQAIKMVIAREMMYRINFFIRMITLFCFELMGPLITTLIYMSSKGILGWSLYEILLLQAVFMFINSIERMFFQRTDWSLSMYVRSGSLDRFLLYPIDTLTLISANNFTPEQIFTNVLSIILFIYSFIQLNISLTWMMILKFIILFIFALVFIYSMAMLRFSIIIRVVVMNRLGELHRTIKNFALYPINVYGPILSAFFKYILPISILTNYPTAVILNRSLENIQYVILSIIILFILTRLFWKNAIKNYASAGG
jgi:ABC-2 type transport system permease protein